MSKGEIEAFAAVFSRAIRLEMEAMRRRLGSFEVPVCGVREEGVAPESGRRPRRWYRTIERTDKLVPGMECTLRAGGAERLVRVVELEADEVLLESDRALPAGAEPAVLVIYPWFLYERLIDAVAAIPGSAAHFPESALAAFGKRPPCGLGDAGPLRAHAELNESQSRALRLCLRSSVAFVWGPPGTGKTVTLGHIVEELHARGARVLVASTTNAAVDQALAKIAALPGLAGPLARGEIVRVGKTEAPTFGAEVGEVARRLGNERVERLRALGEARAAAERGASLAGELLGRWAAAARAPQLDLFDAQPAGALGRGDLVGLAETDAVEAVVRMPAAEQGEFLRALAAERAAEAGAAEERIAALRDELRSSEALVVAQARVILATLSGLTVSSLLAAERFDAVVVEEAGIAVLPAVFHCACLARARVILVGDPRQLPPIVQSDDPYVHRAMGRSIFEVSVPDPASSPVVALLDEQYRMHPAIGGLVSRLSYQGRVRNAVTEAERESISGAPPCPGAAVVLVDTAGTGSCRVLEGSFSRYNEGSAAHAVAVVRELASSGVRSVAVITPYAEQARRLRRLLADAGLRDVECRTVHGFQGNERDAVVLDTVDGEPLPPGVLLAGTGPGSSAASLLNVSISRARGKLVVIADVGYFRRRAPGSPVTRLLDEAERSGAVTVSAARTILGSAAAMGYDHGGKA